MAREGPQKEAVKIVGYLYSKPLGGNAQYLTAIWKPRVATVPKFGRATLYLSQKVGQLYLFLLKIFDLSLGEE